ncbi:MAG: GTP-binding protein [Verrucomicrobiia bacterium Tous-C4TDCM]|jgi:GxxExxY protein|nr:MAG: GTP-binding protein [Verrucomicrobiae bacterium Tous-C4TDCM]
MALILEAETHAILGACFEVYREKGCGFLEDVYQECLELELGDREIPFIARAPLALEYKGRPLRKRYEPDFICFGEVIVEIKACKHLDDSHRAQLMNYLKATGKRVGLLVNFGHYPKTQHERFVL